MSSSIIRLSLTYVKDHTTSTYKDLKIDIYPKSDSSIVWCDKTINALIFFWTIDFIGK